MICVIFTKESFSSSPSFSHQEITDSIHDWSAFPLDNQANCNNITQSLSIPNAKGVSYLSDGNFFNATIWLSGSVNESPSRDHRPMYSMGIGTIPISDTKVKVDYVLTIWWNQLRQSWIRTLEEVSSNDTRVLEEDLNYNGSFDRTYSLRKIEGNDHINLSLDLRKIGAPNQYLALFLVADVNATKDSEGFTQFCGLTDFSDTAVYIPPLAFKLSPSSSPVDLRPGEEKRIELRVNSTSIANPLISLSTNKIDTIDVSLEPNKLYLPPAGIAVSTLKIKALENAQQQPYTIPIYTNISFPKIDVGQYTLPIFSETLNPKINIAQIGEINGTTTDNLSSSIIPRPMYLSLNIQAPLSPQEQFKDFWSAYGGAIGLIGGGFAAGFAALVMDRFKDKFKRT